MVSGRRNWDWQLGVVSFVAMGGAIANSGECAFAQIAPDNTLGAESSVVTPNTGNVDLISGGATRGANLFHSFDQFSVRTGGEAFFNNAASIQNIISRVTGGSVSNIDGLLRANGTANLFLINPNGIIFGPNARLDIGGSFVGSTASAVNFADGTQFSATNPQAPPLLTVNVPIGLQYGGTAGRIVNQSRVTDSSGATVGLQVQPGKTLALVGGDVGLDRGNVFAPGGRVELGGVAGAGTVGLSVDGNNLRLSYPEGVQRADVSLTNGAEARVIAGGGGSIAVNARSLDVLGGSALFAGILSEQGSITSQAGDITLKATETITVAGSNIFNSVIPGAVGKGGNINIQAGSLFLTDNAILATGTFGQGDAGSISVRVDDSVSLANNSFISSSVLRGAVGKGGNIDIQAKSLSLRDNAQLNTGTFGQGDAGSISVRVDDSVSLENSLIFSNVVSGAVGKGGNIDIQALSLSLTNGAQLNSSTRGQGDAGSVTINARDTVSFDGSYAFSIVEEGAVGNGGDINITTGSLAVTGAYLSASTEGRGNGGSVNINARDTVSFDAYAEVSSVVENEAVGNGGDINIQTGSLSVTDGAYLVTDISGQGNAGSITITARDTVSFFESEGLASIVQSGAAGNSGDINITTGSLAVTGAYLFTNTYGQGDAGSVNINARDTVSFDAAGAYTTVEEGAVGNGGDINITTGSLSLTSASSLFTNTYGQGDAGNIQVSATDAIELSGTTNGLFIFSSGLSTETQSAGAAGDINITTRSLALTDSAFLSAGTFGQGDGGNITVNANTLEAANGGQVRATSRSSGKAGNITLNVTDNITLSGSDPTYNAELAQFGADYVADYVSEAGPASGLFASTSEQSTGQGGSLRITTGQLTLRDGAQVSVSSSGAGNAGNLEIAASSIRLDNQALLSSDTTARQGNIFLRSFDLVLRRGSNITTNATGTAEGGNITIDTGVLAALENSDISANAQNARGGRVIIDASGIFGTQFRTQLTPESDITATSDLGPEFSGTVEINDPNVDPEQGLVELPAELADASNQIASGGCAVGENKFTIAGRGGLPPNPREPLNGEAVLTNWATLSEAESREQGAARSPSGGFLRSELRKRGSRETKSTNSTSSAPTQIVEATGWMVNDKGEVVLTAAAPTDNLDIPWLPDSGCHASKPSS